MKKTDYLPYGFYWGHQCSWTLTPANSMQVSNMQSDDSNRKESSPMQGLNLPCPRSLGWMGGDQSGTNISWSIPSPVLFMVL